MFILGCECNYDLCSSQRNGDYKKWKIFDRCLYDAIKALSSRETGSFPVYSGLNGVKMESINLDYGYFVTYVSTSWRKEVSIAFMGVKQKGMLMEFDEGYKNNKYVLCCDVSWISKFPDECEVLFARSTAFVNQFCCTTLDESDGIQTLSLKKRKNKW